MIVDRVKLRLTDEEISEAVLNEYIETVSDRLCIRLGTDELPSQFNSICVDAVVKMYRRLCYEGISSENDGGLSVSFVDDILSEYSDEISAYTKKSGRLRFL